MATREPGSSTRQLSSELIVIFQVASRNHGPVMRTGSVHKKKIGMLPSDEAEQD